MPARPKDWKKRIGEKYGRWEIIGEGYFDKKKRNLLCRCECGTEKHVPWNEMKRGKTLSCGCLRRDVLKEVDHVERVKKMKETIRKRDMGDRSLTAQLREKERAIDEWCGMSMRYEKALKMILRDQGDPDTIAAAALGVDDIQRYKETWRTDGWVRSSAC